MYIDNTKILWFDKHIGIGGSSVFTMNHISKRIVRVQDIVDDVGHLLKAYENQVRLIFECSFHSGFALGKPF